MALPKIASTSYKTKLISDEKVIVEFRPFLTKEQKLLLMALEDGTTEAVTHAISKILKACILTEGVDIDKLPSFDVEKLFIEIRKKSVGEVIELKVGHPEHDADCKCKTKVSVNLDNIRIDRQPGHSKKFKISEELGVVMRYPTNAIMEKVGGTGVNNIFGMIAECIESVYDAETVYADFTKAEMTEWVEMLDTAQLKTITDFFYTMPEVAYDLQYTCDDCGKDVEITLKGMRDFFT